MSDAVGLEAISELVDRYRRDERALDTDGLPWLPIQEGSRVRLLRADMTSGQWIEIFQVDPGARYSRHRHVGGQVLGFVLQGSWRYLERDWVAREGTLVYEPPGDVHTLAAGDEGMTTLFFIAGMVQYLDDQDRVIGQDDVETMATRYLEHCRATGGEPGPIFY